MCAREVAEPLGAPTWERADEIAANIAVEIDWHWCKAPGTIDLEEATNLIKDALRFAYSAGLAGQLPSQPLPSRVENGASPPLGVEVPLPEEMPEWFDNFFYGLVRKMNTGRTVWSSEMWSELRTKLSSGR